MKILSVRLFACLLILSLSKNINSLRHHYISGPFVRPHFNIGFGAYPGYYNFGWGSDCYSSPCYFPRPGVSLSLNTMVAPTTPEEELANIKKQEKRQVVEEIRSLKNDIKFLDNKIKKREKEIDSLKKRLRTASSKKRVGIQKKIDILQEKINSFKKEISDKREKREDLEDKNFVKD